MNKQQLLDKTVIVSDLSFSSALQYNFTNNYRGDTAMAALKIEEKNSLMGIMEKIKSFVSTAIDSAVPEGKLQTLSGVKDFSIVGISTISSVCFIELGKICLGYFIVADNSPDIEYGSGGEDPFYVKKGKYEVQFVLDKGLLEKVLKIISEGVPSSKTAKLNWYYIHDGRQAVQEIPVENPYKLDDRFYPFIKYGDQKQYGATQLMQDFIESKESILLMLGPPGTGKTSFIRHMLCNNKFHACMTYDENIFTKDKFYMDYLLGEQNDLMVVEDADVLLEARTTAGNKDMSKLLNIGDGLVKIDTKKIIFTANLTDSRKIDEAIMRPGRCFAVVNFRNLTQKEADVVCEVSGLDPISGKTEYSLAEIFSRKDAQNKIRKIGFV